MSFSTRQQFIKSLIIFLVVVYGWLLVNILKAGDANLTVCIFRRITSIPCPGCGLTRSVLCIFKGDFYNALLLNPLGYVIAAILIVGPVMLIVNPDKLYQMWNKSEAYLAKHPLLIVLMTVLVFGAWIWRVQNHIGY